MQKHTTPGSLEYAASFLPDKELCAICLVAKDIDHILPVTIEKDNHLLFSVSPDLPRGLALDPKTARISGKPVLPAERTEFTVMGRNMRGQVTAMMVLAVAGIWQNSNPRDWSRAMVQMWLKDQLEMSEDDRYEHVRKTSTYEHVRKTGMNTLGRLVRMNTLGRQV